MSKEVTFVPLSKHDEVNNNYFRLVNAEVNNVFRQLENNEPLINKLKELYEDEKWDLYFSLLSSKPDLFASFSVHFFTYMSLYVALEHKFFGMFSGFLHLLDLMLNDSDEKKQLLNIYHNVALEVVEASSTSELEEASTTEAFSFRNISRICNFYVDQVLHGKVDISILENLTKNVCENINFSINEKAYCVIYLQTTYIQLNMTPRIKLTLYFGQDSKGKAVCWYKDLDLSTVTPYVNYHFDPVLSALKISQYQFSVISSFYVFEYVLRMDDFYLDPVNGEDPDNANMLFGTLALVTELLSRESKVFKKIGNFELPEGFKEILEQDFITFVNDGSIQILETDDSPIMEPLYTMDEKQEGSEESKTPETEEK